MKGLQLEWEDHGKALSNKLWEFFNEDYLVDFSVTCHGQQMKVHKFVLAFLFPLLKESLRTSGTLLLEKEITDSGSSLPKSRGLRLDNIVDHAEDMDYLIQFAYTGKTNVPEEHADCLMRIANRMEIESLKESISQWNKKSKDTNETGQNDVTHLSSQRTSNQPEEDVEVIDVDDTEDEDFSLDSSKDDDDDDDEEEDESSRKTSKQRIEAQKLQRELEKAIKELQKGVKTQPKVKTNKNIKCNRCDFVAKYPCNLQRHMKSHDCKRGLKLTCNLCNKQFYSKNMLEMHCETKCETEPLICKYCGHQSNLKYALVQHIKVKHEVDMDGNPIEKDIKCPDCDFKCYLKYQLRLHVIKNHENKNKFKCKHCEYTAPFNHAIRQHDRLVHKKIKDVVCEECGYRFQTTSYLNRHILIAHRGVKPHTCDICGASFSCLISLKFHKESHSGNMENVCKLCALRCQDRDALRIHMREKHNTELNDRYCKYEKQPVADSTKEKSVKEGDDITD